MKLADLLKDIYSGAVDGRFFGLEIKSIASDTRKMGKNSLFIAQKGFKFNGAAFIAEAIEKGAVAVAFEESENIPIADERVCWLSVSDTQDFLKRIAGKFYDYPSQKLVNIGVTGTNGKTTITYLLESILNAAGKNCGVIGTINYRYAGKSFPSVNTTPGFLENQKYFAELVAEGVECNVMEVSSHALTQGRVDLVNFSTAVFTNLTSDHLDYHKNRENYFNAKAKLFIDLAPEATAVINVDDPYGRKLCSKTQAKVLSYGIQNNADVRAVDIEFDLKGTQFKLITKDDETLIRTKLIGEYNVYNVLAACGVGMAQNINMEKIKCGIENLAAVPGRLERVDCGQDYYIFIDYAHTQDAFVNVLQTIRHFSSAKIIIVFGCGGDRDRTKRPQMGRVACQMADYAIVTTDNPRSEDPMSIINEILVGFDKDNYEVIVNREEAIHKALSLAKKGDIVLIMGKGHENYQTFKDVTIAFDERQIVRQYVLC